MPVSKHIAVIGGGITGLFIAKESAQVGHKVTLFEKGVLGKETSDNSLRIIHGGFRYLQRLELLRVLTSKSDQRAFHNDFLKMTKPLTCYMPLKKSGLKSAPFCWIASKIYKSFAPESEARTISFHNLPNKLQKLSDTFKYGALAWNDITLLDPDGVIKALKIELLNKNISLREHHLVTTVQRQGSGFVVRGATTDGEFQEEFSSVVNASGPWIQSLSLIDIEKSPPKKWCKGFNLVISESFIDDCAIALHGKGRLFFVVPRDDGTAIGTWYVPSSGPWDSVAEHEVLEFLESFNQVSPFNKLNIGSIKKVESGVLPASDSGKDVLRNSKIGHDRGYIEILSTKYTEARSLAKRVVTTLQS